LPRSERTSPGWVPGANSSDASPSSVGTVTVVPAHGLGERELDRADEIVAVRA